MINQAWLYRVFLIPICILFLFHSRAQETDTFFKATELNIGDNVPDQVWQEITAGKKPQLVILDFWTTTCANCIEAFPKMEKFQKQFSNKLRVVLVNSSETGTQIKNRFDKINKNRKDNKIELPNLPQISGDSVLKQLFPHDGVPHHVWLNGEGKVLYITNGQNATETNIRAVLNGTKVWMEEKRDLGVRGYFSLRDRLIKPTFSEFEPSAYSGFFRYHPGLPGSGGWDFDSARKEISYITANTFIIYLYQLAFNANRILADTKQKDALGGPEYGEKDDDRWKAENMFSYEVKLTTISNDKEKQKEELRKYMQDDINRFFEKEYGIVGKMEIRRLPCFILKQTKPGLLKTAGGELEKDLEDNERRIWRNVSFYSFVNHYLKNKLEDMTKPIAFLDETGIDKKVRADFVFEGNLDDIENLRYQLQKYGLDIVIEERDIEVLVIADKVN